MTEHTSANNEQAQQEEAERKYERIGAELRRRREELGLEQDDVARRLHLPGMIINDIETGQVDQLSSIYRRGYIRNYAQLLDIEPDALLVDAGEDILPELQEVLPVSRGEWRLERYLKIATYALVTVAIVPPLVYFFIAGGTRMLERDVAAEEPPTVAGAPEAAQQRDATENRSSSEELPSDEAATNRHVSASAIPLKPIRPARESRREPAVDAAAAEVGNASDEALAEEAGPPPSALELELLEDSWIEIHDAEGTRLEYDLLRSGQTRNYEGEPPFRLLVGRSSAVKLRFNGHPVTWEGDESGDMAEIAISGDGEVQR
ncbi:MULTISPECIES: RodZ domain-containing protein [unclassified Wenzhouxiangella]|uniref:RodZ domain-containing protein n=1 Tax=unclassified Wenzhouxiangella TaxID=2613841 RepID=UPI000E32A1A7|nr:MULTISPECIES: RodZ domain-containing protein [unclassified Wenzhouxiangella]RFF27969.1 helix-turn-helix domain-containing protein [Wenzhouxiangella sp. 15181]RFP68556.1 helix-turn-helix domain-containing protein [Wenzhouxiangella sp. 15190]